MNILFIGDVFGKAGRKMLEKHMNSLAKKYSPDLIIVNAENMAHGRGVREKDLSFLRELGVHVITGGNHSFDTKDAEEVLKDPYALRPANYPLGVMGKGDCVYKNTLVINLIGRVFMPEGTDSPFQSFDMIMKKHEGKNFDAIIVDFHAETTSEKTAFLHYVSGKVTAVLGTHTHVQTADERIVNGTAFISDVGMTGPEDSVIGMDKDAIVKRFLTGLPTMFSPASAEPVLSGVCIQTEDGKAIHIERILIRDS